MRVHELIKILKDLPQDLEVLTASDDKGNSFRKIPTGWVTTEKFDINLDIIANEDLKNYNYKELKTYVVIG